MKTAPGNGKMWAGSRLRSLRQALIDLKLDTFKFQVRLKNQAHARSRSCSDAAKELLSYALRHWIRSLFLLAIFAALLVFTSITAAFFFTILLACILLPVDGRVPAIFAFFAFGICLLFLLARNNQTARHFALWAFYFLIMWLAVQFKEMTGSSAAASIDEGGPQG